MLTTDASGGAALSEEERRARAAEPLEVATRASTSMFIAGFLVHLAVFPVILILPSAAVLLACLALFVAAGFAIGFRSAASKRRFRGIYVRGRADEVARYLGLAPEAAEKLAGHDFDDTIQDEPTYPFAPLIGGVINIALFGIVLIDVRELIDASPLIEIGLSVLCATAFAVFGFFLSGQYSHAFGELDFDYEDERNKANLPVKDENDVRVIALRAKFERELSRVDNMSIESTLLGGLSLSAFFAAVSSDEYSTQIRDTAFREKGFFDVFDPVVQIGLDYYAAVRMFILRSGDVAAATPLADDLLGPISVLLLYAGATFLGVLFMRVPFNLSFQDSIQQLMTATRMNEKEEHAWQEANRDADGRGLINRNLWVRTNEQYYNTYRVFIRRALRTVDLRYREVRMILWAMALLRLIGYACVFCLLLLATAYFNFEITFGVTTLLFVVVFLMLLFNFIQWTTRKMEQLDDRITGD